MFRRLPKSLPLDPVPPATLAGMGYFVNDEDQIRMISFPDRSYQFKIDRNDRVNEVHRATMNDRIREIVHQRLSSLGLNVLRLPLGTPDREPHVPVYVSKNFHEHKRVLVVFGSRDVDPGIFSFRAIGHLGISTGSATNMAKALFDGQSDTDEGESVALLIANPYQLIWHRSGAKAIGDAQWLGLPRPSAVHQPFGIDQAKNRVTENADYVEHVKYIFEYVMNGQAHPNATFDIIGMEYTGMAVMHYLAAHWDDWKDKVNGVCLGNPQHTFKELQDISLDNKQFLNFVKKRVRGYMVSDMPVDTLVSGIERAGCNCYSSGEEYYEDHIMVKGWKSMLDWFKLIATTKDSEEPTFSVIDKVDNISEDQNAVAEANEGW